MPRQNWRTYIRWREAHWKWVNSDPSTRGEEPKYSKPSDVPNSQPPGNESKPMSKRTIRFSHDLPPDRYELTLGWNEEEFIDDGQVGFSVTATRHGIDENGKVIAPDAEKLSASVAIVQLRDNENPENLSPVLIVTVQNEPAFELPLGDLFDEALVIDSIPSTVFGAGDPVLGCLVRSGLSSVVGQIIWCKNETAGMSWQNLRRLREIAGCLLDNISNITARLAGRAALCVFKFGV